jgi:hypothetical protein
METCEADLCWPAVAVEQGERWAVRCDQGPLGRRMAGGDGTDSPMPPTQGSQKQCGGQWRARATGGGLINETAEEETVSRAGRTRRPIYLPNNRRGGGREVPRGEAAALQGLGDNPRPCKGPTTRRGGLSPREQNPLHPHPLHM